MDSLTTQQITPEQFEKAVGRPPQDDDMDRCNCEYAGKIGHRMCGWNAEHNLPNSMVEVPL